jgi:ectoine hydroxylase
MTDHYPSRCEAEPRLIPRIDPVCHRTWEEGAPLTRGQAEQFERDGFVLLENLFDADEIAALQAETRSLIENADGIDPATIITERGGDEVRSIFEIHDQSRAMKRLACDARLVDVARFLLDDDVYIHQSRLNYKPGFQGKEFFWHSDFETWHVEDGMPRMRAVSMSILLTPNTPNNGPLMLIPGSHKSFLTCVGATPENHYLTSLKKQEFGVPDEASLTNLVRAHGLSVPLGAQGSVVVFDCNTMHGSNGNITPDPRSNAFFVYNAMTNRTVEPFGAKERRPSFVAARRFEPVEAARGSLVLQPA